MDIKNILTKFNSGKVVESSVFGASNYREVVVEVKQVKLVSGDNDHVNKYLHNPQALFLQVDLSADDGSEWSEWQKLNINEDGKVTNWYSPRWQDKNGDLVGNSLCTDILLKAAEYDEKQREAVKGIEFSRAKFEGLKFKLNIRDFIDKDSGEANIKAQWDRQLLYEEQREKERAAETESNKAIETEANAQASDTQFDAAFEEQKAIADTATPIGSTSEEVKPVDNANALWD